MGLIFIFGDTMNNMKFRVETLVSQIVKTLGEFEHKTERKSYIEYDENSIKIDLF